MKAGIGFGFWFTLIAFYMIYVWAVFWFLPLCNEGRDNKPLADCLGMEYAPSEEISDGLDFF